MVSFVTRKGISRRIAQKGSGGIKKIIKKVELSAGKPPFKRWYLVYYRSRIHCGY